MTYREPPRYKTPSPPLARRADEDRSLTTEAARPREGGRAKQDHPGQRLAPVCLARNSAR